MDKIPEYFYRFRSIDNLLGARNELENQEIYFASPEQLNDPMEGFKNISWKGDDIVWKNLLKNYLFCLERVCSLFIIGGEEYSIESENIPIFGNDGNFPTEVYKNIFEEICSSFFGKASVLKYIEKLASKTNSAQRDELCFHLTTLHIVAVETIFGIYENKGLIKSRAVKKNYVEKLEKNLLSSLRIFDLLETSAQNSQGIEKAIAESFFAKQRNIGKELNLIDQLNYSGTSNFANKDFIFRYFPEEYVRKLETLLYPEWYTACFMSEKSISNASVWGHYSDGHKGVCLKFKPSFINEMPSMELYGKNGCGSSGSTYEIIHLPFHKIRYEKEHVEIDFFKSLGMLSKSQLSSFWYTDQNGNSSICSNDIFETEEKWRQNHQVSFINSFTTKLKDWSYEKEYRLVLSCLIPCFYKDEVDRKFKFNFSDLDGIIFGMNTKHEEKLKIIKIIEDKCRKEDRKEFNFFQAFYSKEKSCIDCAKMEFIKFAEP